MCQWILVTENGWRLFPEIGSTTRWLFSLKNFWSLEKMMCLRSRCSWQEFFRDLLLEKSSLLTMTSSFKVNIGNIHFVLLSSVVIFCHFVTYFATDKIRSWSRTNKLLNRMYHVVFAVISSTNLANAMAIFYKHVEQCAVNGDHSQWPPIVLCLLLNHGNSHPLYFLWQDIRYHSKFSNYITSLLTIYIPMTISGEMVIYHFAHPFKPLNPTACGSWTLLMDIGSWTAHV